MARKLFALLTTPEKGAVIIAVFIVLLGIFKSVSYTVHYGGNDLRTRVVGARLLGTGQSPYFYKWHPGDPEQFIDPSCRIYGIVANALTVTPALLYFQSLITWMSYPYIHVIWNIFQYILCLFIFWFILSRNDSTTLNRLYVLVIGSVFFLCSTIWLFNIEAGQAYIIFPACMCLLYYLITKKTRPASLVAGLLFALVVYSRPNFIFLGLPLLLTLNRRFIVGSAAAGILLLIHAYTNQDLWRDYFTAVSMHAKLNLHAIVEQDVVIYPTIIEGTDNVAKFKVLDVAGFPPLRWLFANWHLHNSYSYIILYAAVASFVLFFFRNVIKKGDARLLMLLGFLLYIISEFFIPATRGGYNLIQWIFPVLLILHSKSVTKLQVMMMVTGLCLVVSFPVSMRFTHSGGELLLIYSLIDYIRRNVNQGSSLKAIR
jgi:hypothetical protein